MGTPTALHAATRAAGATFTELLQCDLPETFGDREAEYRAIREGAALLDLGHRGLLRVTGTDRGTWLHGMVTNAVQDLPPGSGCAAAVTTIQGRMVAEIAVSVHGDRLDLECPAFVAEDTRAHLERYLISEDAELTDVSAATAHLALQGPAAEQVLTALGASPPSGAAHRHADGTLAGRPVTLLRRDETGADGWVLRLDRAGAEAVWTALREGGATPVGVQAWTRARIAAGIPWFGIDHGPETIPLELPHRDALVSFEKGCYLGQEVVARLEHLGTPARRLVGLRVEARTAPAPGSPVTHEETPVGAVTSAAAAPAGPAIALAFLSKGAYDPGTAVRVASGAEAVPATGEGS